MKCLLYLYAFLFFGYPNNSLNEFLDSNYKGGSNLFFETIYKAILYPADARANCRVGKLIATISIDQDGEIESIEFIGKLDYGIEEQLKATLMLSSGNWIKSEGERKFAITIAYKLNDLPDIRGDITVNAYLSNDAKTKSNSLCETNEELLKYFESCLKNNNCTKAKEVADELLRRDPISKFYQKLYDKASKELMK